jgi:class 3 adenylate cyclase
LPGHTRGAALFADISGFTPLSEARDRALRSAPGAEALTRQLSQIYDALIAKVERYGGSVIGFAGDSITCWFNERVIGDGAWVMGDKTPIPITHHPIPNIRAVASAQVLQQAMRQFATIALPDGTSTQLALKIAIACGPARRLVVGDSSIQQIDTLAGATVSRIAAGEHLAQQGETLVDTATAAVFGQQTQIAEWRVGPDTDESFAVLALLRANLDALTRLDLTPLALPEPA